MTTHIYETVQEIELNNMVEKHTTHDWIYIIQFYNCLHFGERIDTNWVAIKISPDYSKGNTHIQKLEHWSAASDTDVYSFVDNVDKTKKSTTVITLSN